MKKGIFTAKFWTFEADSKLPFGKYQGVELSQVFANDAEYIGFCIRKIIKFIISVKCFKILNDIDKIWFENNGDILYILWNKELDKKRVLNENTRFGYNSYNKIINFKSNNEYSLLYKYNSESLKNLGFTNGNVIKDSVVFNINILDVKDLEIFRKYNLIYGRRYVKVFEIVKNTRFGPVVIVVSMDFQEWSRQDPLIYKSYFECVIPDDWECVVYVVNKTCNHEVIIGERLRTEEEVQAKLMDLERCDGDYFRSEDDIREEVIKIFERRNAVFDVIDMYAQYRVNSKYKNINLFTDTDLANYSSYFNFDIKLNELDKIVRDWYIDIDDLKTYEYRKNKLARASDEVRDEVYSNNDGESRERDAWDALTDG